MLEKQMEGYEKIWKRWKNMKKDENICKRWKKMKKRIVLQQNNALGIPCTDERVFDVISKTNECIIFNRWLWEAMDWWLAESLEKKDEKKDEKSWKSTDTGKKDENRGFNLFSIVISRVAIPCPLTVPNEKTNICLF